MFKFSKKYFILVIILSLILLVGCEGGSYMVIKGEVDANKNSITGDYNIENTCKLHAYIINGII